MTALTNYIKNKIINNVLRLKRAVKCKMNTITIFLLAHSLLDLKC